MQEYPGSGPHAEVTQLEEKTQPEPPPNRPAGRRLFALAEVALAALAGSFFASVAVIFVGADHADLQSSSRLLGLLLFVDATVTMAFLWGMQRLRGRTLASLGWGLEGRRRELWLGVKVFPLLVVLMLVLSVLIEVLLPTWVSKENLVLAMIRQPADLLIFLAASLYAGGVKEEVQRAFILTRFEEHLGGAVPGLILWSTVFGALHYIQGPDNAVKAGVLGLALGLLYWKRQRLEAPIVAHALFDVMVVFLVYFFPGLATSG